MQPGCYAPRPDMERAVRHSDPQRRSREPARLSHHGRRGWCDRRAMDRCQRRFAGALSCAHGARSGRHNGMTDIDTTPAWCSDALATLLRELGIRYIALSPGSSFRGLHESLVNLLGNRDPEMLLCLHEEHAVAMAHGYAKVAGRPMGAIVHSNVGLMHATMAIFNAWCDRAPVVVLGATGPVDAAKRRPW